MKVGGCVWVVCPEVYFDSACFISSRQCSVFTLFMSRRTIFHCAETFSVGVLMCEVNSWFGATGRCFRTIKPECN